MREEGDRNLRALWDDGVPELVQPLLLVGVGHPLMHRDLVGLVPDLAGHALQRLRVNFPSHQLQLLEDLVGHRSKEEPTTSLLWASHIALR